MYEQISMKQHQAVSRVISISTEKKMYHEELENSGEKREIQKSVHSVGRLFGDLTNCSIGSISIVINPPAKKTVDEEFDEIASSIDLHVP